MLEGRRGVSFEEMERTVVGSGLDGGFCRVGVFFVDLAIVTEELAW